MVRRHELTDEQFARLAPLLPAERPRTGRPNHDHRMILNGIVWRLNTGAPWRDLPERYGPWTTVYSRFRRWQRAGVWDRLLAAVQTDANACGAVDWSLHFLDGTTIRAHPQAAGAPKKGAAVRHRPPAPSKDRRSVAAGAASPPSSICAPIAPVGRSPGR